MNETHTQATIFWTLTDEAPFLASHSFLPMVQAFLKEAGIYLDVKNISLAARILAVFSDLLPEDKRVPDDLALLGKTCLLPEANIIKLPNISASVSQLKAAILELQTQGFPIPNYPENPATDEDQLLLSRFSKVLGSAVNPVLREGNSDRRAPPAIKNFARTHPHKLAPWSQTSRAKVAHMTGGDFYGNERALTAQKDDVLRIEFQTLGGEKNRLKMGIPLSKGEIVDTTFMAKKALLAFYEGAMQEAKEKELLLSLHLKATMMKISDPVLFGAALFVYFQAVFQKHEKLFDTLHIRPELGLSDLFAKLDTLPLPQKERVLQDFQRVRADRPKLAMVDSAKGISNFHVPSDIIIDASMPVMIRDGGKMWDEAGALKETLAMIPDRSYATIYQAIIEDCQQNGALDPATMGSVANIGLMAAQAEEYGSHETTFIAPSSGLMRVLGDKDTLYFETPLEEGDIWRLCRVKDEAIENWVALAVERARLTQSPVVFWLDDKRPHDVEVIQKVRAALAKLPTEGLELSILSPKEAMRFTLKNVRQGRDVISVTGNVLRDYLTDLFPILEVGTSAKMLSIVPLLAGGRLFETGAGGSAPKHVQQFLSENHLRWDSLGEFLALGASLEHIGECYAHDKAALLAAALDQAIAKFLDENRSPSRTAGGLDNRGSHFYLARYWAEALATQQEDLPLSARFQTLAQAFKTKASDIISELLSNAGKPVDLGGYYHPTPEKLTKAMRSSATLNAILEKAFG